MKSNRDRKPEKEATPSNNPFEDQDANPANEDAIVEEQQHVAAFNAVSQNLDQNEISALLEEIEEIKSDAAPKEDVAADDPGGTASRIEDEISMVDTKTETQMGDENDENDEKAFAGLDQDEEIEIEKEFANVEPDIELEKPLEGRDEDLAPGEHPDDGERKEDNAPLEHPDDGEREEDNAPLEHPDNGDRGENAKPEGDKVPKETGAHENKTSKKGSIIRWGLTITIAGMIMLAAVLILFKTCHKPKPEPEKRHATIPAKPVKHFAVELSNSNANPEPPSLADRLADKLAQAGKLRDELLQKKSEIADLKRYFKNRIEQTNLEILQEKANQGITTLQQALKHKQIELSLRSIQRRRAFIEELDRPTQRLERGSEALLYLKRKIAMHIQLLPIVERVEPNALMNSIDTIIQHSMLSSANLALDLKDVKPDSLETIWQRLSARQKQNPGNKSAPTKMNAPGPSRENKKNLTIGEQICRGNFMSTAELTALSTEAAKCLSKSREADLFLNGIEELSPEAAKYLFQWDGKWICLNGIKKLSPEVARHLSNWKGQWISLNGLSELALESAIFLPEWQGTRLELMGLIYKGKPREQMGFKYLARWEKSGGKVYVPDKIRKIMDQMQR